MVKNWQLVGDPPGGTTGTTVNPALQVNILDFTHVVLFQNQSASKATWVENPGQISDFLTPCKIRGGVGKMSECHFKLESRTHPLIYLSRGLLSELRDLVFGKKKHISKI